MTNYVSQYNFMDLLKENGAVPHVEENSISLIDVFRGLVGQLSTNIEQTHASYDFMDLLYDKGFVPVYCNDNHLTAKVA